MVETSTSVWYVPDAGEPSELEGTTIPAVSPDGRVLVATVADELVAYELPSLRELGRVTPALGYGYGPMAEGVVDGRVLVRGVRGSPGQTGVAVWDLATGTVTPSPAWTSSRRVPSGKVSTGRSRYGRPRHHDVAVVAMVRRT